MPVNFKIYKINSLPPETLDILKTLSKLKLISTIQIDGFIGIARDNVSCAANSPFRKAVKEYAQRLN